MQSLVDGPQELAPSIAMALLKIVDMPKTRVYLQPGCDLEVRLLLSGCSIPSSILKIALSPFTDAYARGGSNSEHMKVASKVISVMMRSWSGRSTCFPFVVA